MYVVADFVSSWYSGRRGTEKHNHKWTGERLQVHKKAAHTAETFGTTSNIFPIALYRKNETRR